MSKTPTLRSVRLLPLTYGIDGLANQPGEVFYDAKTNTLRIMDGVRRGGFPVATKEWVDLELTSAVNDLQTQIDNAIESIPEVDLTPYYTKLETDSLLENVSVDLTGYATETYVDDAVANVQVDLTGYATETFVNNTVNNLVDSAPGALDTLNELAAALGDDASFSATVTNQLSLKANTDDLGSAAFTQSTAYATAFQGTLADSALQPLDGVSSLVNDAGYITGIAVSGLASEAYVDNAISDLIGAAPDALNTLTELATALGNDENFATTVTTSIGQKANTLDLGAAAFTNDIFDLDNTPDFTLFSNKFSGAIVTNDTIVAGSPLIRNIDGSVSIVRQEQSYVFSTFTGNANVIGTLQLDNFRTYQQFTNSYGLARNGPMKRQTARLGNTIHTLTSTNGNQFLLSAYTEDAAGTLTLQRNTLINGQGFPTNGVINGVIVADPDKNQLIVLVLNSQTTANFRYYIIDYDETTQLYSFGTLTTATGVTVAGVNFGSSDFLSINAIYDETHNKLIIAGDTGLRAYVVTYTNNSAALVPSSYISTSTSTSGAAVPGHMWDVLHYSPSSGNYFVIWGYNTTSMKSVILDTSGNPSWGPTLTLTNELEDIAFNTEINQFAIVTTSSNQIPTVTEYTYNNDGTFNAPGAPVELDSGVSAYNNISLIHFDPRTKKYLLYTFYTIPTNNFRIRPSWASSDFVWNIQSVANGNRQLVANGIFSGDYGVYQLLYERNNNIRYTRYTIATGPIVTNLTAETLIGISYGNYNPGDTVSFFGLGDTADILTDLVPNSDYYVTTSGTLTNNGSLGEVLIGRAVDANSLYITLNSGSGASVSVSDTPPVSAASGDLWWESESGRLKVYYQDADTSQWVDASPPINTPTTPYIVGSANGTTFRGSGFTGVQNSTGNYSITFNTPLPNANYSVMTTAENVLDRFVIVTNKTINGFTLLAQTNAGVGSGVIANFAVYNIG